MTREEIITRSAELRVRNIREELRRLVYGDAPPADPLIRYADPEPPRDVTLPAWKRGRWVRRLMRR